MQNKDTISFKHWSLRVGRADVRTRTVPLFWGEIVVAVEDLHQSIVNLILTPLGSVPTEPEMGCDLYPYIDRTQDIAIPNITRAIWDALAMWEPRITVLEINVTEAGFAQLRCDIHWRPVDGLTDDLQVTSVPVSAEKQAA